VPFTAESDAKLVHSFYGSIERAAKFREISALVDETTEAAGRSSLPSESSDLPAAILPQVPDVEACETSSR
jgi:hypothetical protein